jgi:S-adenosylmethionine hydrolase
LNVSASDLTVRGRHSRLERVRVAANLRHSAHDALNAAFESGGTTGLAFEDLGADVDASSLTRVDPVLLDVGVGRITCETTDIDGFGNVRLSARAGALAAAGLEKAEELYVLVPNGEISVHRAATFGALARGRMGLIVDSFGWLILCMNRESAAKKLDIERGARVELRAHPWT